MINRYILVGGPRTGKSTYARHLRQQGIPTYCTDPESLVKYPEAEVHYLPEGLDWSESSQYVADYWIPMSGSWCIEGVATVRALRKYFKSHDVLQAEIVLLLDQFKEKVTRPGQNAMNAGVITIWNEIEPIAGKYVKHDDEI